MRPEPFFSGPGLDRADQLRATPEKIAELATRHDARELVWQNGIPAMNEDGNLCWQHVTDASLFLGFSGEEPRFSPLADPATQAFSVMPLLTQLADAEAPLFAAVMSLARWHARHRFCANCGRDTKIVRGGWSRSCPDCAAEHFPRVDPVVIMLVEHDGKVLLGRQPHYPPGRYSALAGFVEVGESIEAAVAREVKEGRFKPRVIELGTKDDVVTLVLNPAMTSRIPAATRHLADSLGAEMHAGRFTAPTAARAP